MKKRLFSTYSDKESQHLGLWRRWKRERPEFVLHGGAKKFDDRKIVLFSRQKKLLDGNGICKRNTIKRGIRNGG